MGDKPSKLSPKEEARANKRVVDKSVRHIDREVVKLGNLEKKTLDQIKKLAQKNQHVSTRHSWISTLRVRNKSKYVNNLY